VHVVQDAPRECGADVTIDESYLTPVFILFP